MGRFLGGYFVRALGKVAWSQRTQGGGGGIWRGPPVSHSVGLLLLYGALGSHPFFPSHVASGRCVLSAAAASALAGVVSAFAEPSCWCAGAVLRGPPPRPNHPPTTQHAKGRMGECVFALAVCPVCTVTFFCVCGWVVAPKHSLSLGCHENKLLHGFTLRLLVSARLLCPVKKQPPDGMSHGGGGVWGGAGKVVYLKWASHVR